MAVYTSSTLRNLIKMFERLYGNKFKELEFNFDESLNESAGLTPEERDFIIDRMKVELDWGVDPDNNEPAVGYIYGKHSGDLMKSIINKLQNYQELDGTFNESLSEEEHKFLNK